MTDIVSLAREKLLSYVVSCDQDTGEHIGVPHKFVSPNSELFANDLFYWDSYFMLEALLDIGEIDLCRGIVDNFVFLFERFGKVPLRNKLYNVGISQPPFLALMVRRVFEHSGDRSWLDKVMPVVEKEYSSYWLDDFHLDKSGLSRYCDHYVVHATAEHESGWDMTSRFASRALDFLPVDLNSLLFMYEDTLEWYYNLSGKLEDANKWSDAKGKRRQCMIDLLQGKQHHFFFDYDVSTGSRRHFWSLAGFFPLFAGLVNDKEAALLVRQLAKFEYDFGLATTQHHHLPLPFKQWDYPNGWANLQFIVCTGLLRYGYIEEASRIAGKYMRCIEHVFSDTGEFWEKYNVVDGTVGKSGRYPTQSGFGWTCAFVMLSKRFLKTFP